MAYCGKMLFFCLWSTLHAVSWARQNGCKEEMLIFYWPLSKQSPGIDQFTMGGTVDFLYGPLSTQSPGLNTLAVRGELEFRMVHSASLLDYRDCLAGDDCKHNRPATCLPTGSWGILEMHGLVETWAYCDADILSGCLFRVDLLSTPWTPGQCSLLLWVGLSFSAWHCSDQAGCGCSLVYTVTYCFPFSTGVYLCHHVVLLWLLPLPCNTFLMPVAMVL